MEGLANARGKTEGAMEDMESDGSNDEEPCKYFQIQACGPNGIADTDGGFAKKLYDICVKYSSRKPIGFMTWPRDFSKVKWMPGELSLSGGEDYLVPFQTKATNS